MLLLVIFNIETGKLRYNLGRGSKGMHHKEIQLFFYKLCNKPQRELVYYMKFKDPYHHYSTIIIYYLESLVLM